MSETIFHYHPVSGVFLGSGVARESPLETGVYFVPANATTDAPPPCQAGEQPVYINGVWEVQPILQSTPEPEPEPKNAKEEVWELIKAERDRITQSGGYPLDGYWFHSDAYSLSQQQGLILAAMQVQAAGGDMNAPLMATPWYAMGSVPVEMTASLALRLLPAAMEQQVAIFEAAKAHKVAMEGSADPAAYDYTKNWPKVFGSQQ